MPRCFVVFEDEGCSNLYPLTLTRPVFGLICGTMTLAERIRWELARSAADEGPWQEAVGGSPRLNYHLRDYLAPGLDASVRSYENIYKTCDVITFINGRLLFDAGMLGEIDPGRPGRYISGGQVAVANVPKDRSQVLDRLIGRPLSHTTFDGLPAVDLDARLVTYPWELVGMNGGSIESDFELLGGRLFKSEPPSMVHMLREDRIRIGSDVRLSPGVVVDASKGPVILEDGVRVMANASLEGPLHVGAGTIIKMGAKIYGETSIGPVSKIGGEVAETIVQGFANKQHEGFVGHSYLGEWVNLGAGTETSDMKNNYSPVRVPISGSLVDSGEMFVGLFMGDHSKSGIGSVFSTGSVIGVCCNIFGADYPPKYIPSFAWGGSSGFDEYDPDRAIETARVVMARRGKQLDPHAESVLRHVHGITSGEREEFLK
jgi:UDP-N-acetylglucosamine diphosphorylase/glucosamine-1-phosphate N-acetyltransferase